ncbi:MAG TPA: hypothetical protein PK156_13700, partial [Polyangium sp.]|nr:hypothetical protein [Polyangium sp.]
MTRDSSLLSSGLPSRFVLVVTQAFGALDCTEPRMLALVELLGALAKAYGLPEPRTIQRIFSLLAAANHTYSRLSGPRQLFAQTEASGIPSTSEWLLLTARERAGAALPPELGHVVDMLITQLDAVFVRGDADDVASPIFDYGLGQLLGAFHENASDARVVVAGCALGKLTRLTLELLVASRPSGPVLAPLLLRSLTDRDPKNTSRLDLALALANKPAPDKLPLVSYLGQAHVRARIAETVATWSEEAFQGFDGEQLNLVRAFVHMLDTAITEKNNTLRIFGFAKTPSLA